MPQKRNHPLPPISIDPADGKRLAKFRKARGFTQVQLANRVGISQTLLSAYEIGRLGLSADMVRRFCLQLEVSADVMLGLESPAEPE